jgi:hypothetical protein
MHLPIGGLNAGGVRGSSHPIWVGGLGGVFMHMEFVDQCRYEVLFSLTRVLLAQSRMPRILPAMGLQAVEVTEFSSQHLASRLHARSRGRFLSGNIGPISIS